MAHGHKAYVPFVNETNQTITFVMEFGSTEPPRHRFTLQPRGSHDEPVPTSTPGGTDITDEKLRLYVGADANDQWTNNVVTTGELVDLEKIVVITAGEDFILDKQPRRSTCKRITDYLKGFLPGERAAGHGPTQV